MCYGIYKNDILLIVYNSIAQIIADFHLPRTSYGTMVMVVKGNLYQIKPINGTIGKYPVMSQVIKELIKEGQEILISPDLSKQECHRCFEIKDLDAFYNVNRKYETICKDCYSTETFVCSTCKSSYGEDRRYLYRKETCKSCYNNMRKLKY